MNRSTVSAEACAPNNCGMGFFAHRSLRPPRSASPMSRAMRNAPERLIDVGMGTGEGLCSVMPPRTNLHRGTFKNQSE